MANKYWIEFFDKDDNYIQTSGWFDTKPSADELLEMLPLDATKATVFEADENDVNMLISGVGIFNKISNPLFTITKP